MAALVEEAADRLDISHGGDVVWAVSMSRTWRFRPASAGRSTGKSLRISLRGPAK
jgi:hypothetical protein